MVASRSATSVTVAPRAAVPPKHNARSPAMRPPTRPRIIIATLHTQAQCTSGRRPPSRDQSRGECNERGELRIWNLKTRPGERCIRANKYLFNEKFAHSGLHRLRNLKHHPQHLISFSDPESGVAAGGRIARVALR